MVTIAVVAILAAVAYPNMAALINSQRLSATTNELIAGLQIARAEAIRRNLRVALCRSTDGLTCAGGTGTWTRWIVIAADEPGEEFDELIKDVTVALPVQVRATAIADDSVVFRADGLARSSPAAVADLLNGSISVCIPTTQPAKNARTISIASGSRISTIQVATGTGTCP